MRRLRHVPIARLAAIVIVVTATVATGVAARAETVLPAPPSWDAARCGPLSVSAGRAAGEPGARRFARWRVVLGNPTGGDGGRLRAASLATDGAPALDALASLFAGALLVADEPHRPRGCDLAHGFREAAASLAGLAPGASASERWTGVRASAGPSDAQAATLVLQATHGVDGVARLRSTVTDFSTAGNDMTAAPIGRIDVQLSLPFDEARRLAAGETPRADDRVTLDRAVIKVDDGSNVASVEATGTYVPLARSGRFHVVAADLEALKDALPAGERTEAGAAFLVLRLAAHSEPDGGLSWDVALDNNRVTINGVPVPLLR